MIYISPQGKLRVVPTTMLYTRARNFIELHVRFNIVNIIMRLSVKNMVIDDDTNEMR